MINCLIHESLAKYKKVQVGKDQEKAQSEKDSHSKNLQNINLHLMIFFSVRRKTFHE